MFLYDSQQTDTTYVSVQQQQQQQQQQQKENWRTLQANRQMVVQGGSFTAFRFVSDLLLLAHFLSFPVVS